MEDARLWPLLGIGVVGAAFGLWLVWWMMNRAINHLAGRLQPPISGVLYLFAAVTAAVMLMAASGALSLYGALRGWRQFTKKTHVAELQAVELGPHKLRVYLVPIEGDGVRGGTEIYDLDGDEWQVGGDILRFKSFATALGIDPVFRLQRVEGRWVNAADASAHKATAYDRAPPSTAWLSLYRGVDKPPLKWMVAGAHGQSVSQLPDRRAVFDIYVTPNGYIVDKRSL
jgi:hypothetical protein